MKVPVSFTQSVYVREAERLITQIPKTVQNTTLFTRRAGVKCGVLLLAICAVLGVAGLAWAACYVSLAVPEDWTATAASVTTGHAEIYTGGRITAEVDLAEPGYYALQVSALAALLQDTEARQPRNLPGLFLTRLDAGDRCKIEITDPSSEWEELLRGRPASPIMER